MRTERICLAALGTLTVALVALAAGPRGAGAQWGGAVGFRVPTSTSESVRNSGRSGYEARVYFDHEVTPRWGLRGEVAYTQMQFRRDVDTAEFKVSENGFEMLAQFRAMLPDGPFAGAFATVGPVASFRAACGTYGTHDSNGRVACDEGDTFLAGWMIGAGYRWPTGGRNDYTLEVRYFGNDTTAAGGQPVAVAYGVRWARSLRRADDR
jgi:hypothetical protein